MPDTAKPSRLCAVLTPCGALGILSKVTTYEGGDTMQSEGRLAPESKFGGRGSKKIAIYQLFSILYWGAATFRSFQSMVFSLISPIISLFLFTAFFSYRK